MSKRNMRNQDPYTNPSYHNQQTSTSQESRGRRIGKRVAWSLASAGALAAAVEFSGPVVQSVEESSHPKAVVEQLSEADYQTSIIRPALESVDNATSSIYLIKSTLKSDLGTETGSAGVVDGNHPANALTIGRDNLHFIQNSEFGDGENKTIMFTGGDIAIVRDETGTSIDVSLYDTGRLLGKTPYSSSQKITFRNPNKDLQIDLTDPSTLGAAAADPETVVISVSAEGEFSDGDQDDQAWYTAEVGKPLTVTFERNEDGSFQASTNSDSSLKTPYGVSPSITPSMQDILDFEFRLSQ